MARLSKNVICGFILAVTWCVIAFVRMHEGASYVAVAYSFFISAFFTVVGVYYVLVDLNKIHPIKVGKKFYVMSAVFVIFVCAVFFIAASNYSVKTNKINVKSERIPEAFDGFCIAQVSDLHNAKFDKSNKRILQPLFAAEPDIIVITGDMIDSRRTNVDTALHFASRAAKIAPTYYVNGNHESRVPEVYERLKKGMLEAGVTVLENSSVDITVEGETITLVGINDPMFSEKTVSQQLEEAVPDNDAYKILLAHRPEYFESYVGEVDLVFSGHAHGGQFIIPFLGGFIAPGQGFFPKYYEGMYTKGETGMVVSRGIGNSIIPFRINNKPEIVVAELSKEED